FGRGRGRQASAGRERPSAFPQELTLVEQPLRDGSAQAREVVFCDGPVKPEIHGNDRGRAESQNALEERLGAQEVARQQLDKLETRDRAQNHARGDSCSLRELGSLAHTDLWGSDFIVLPTRTGTRRNEETRNVAAR